MTYFKTSAKSIAKSLGISRLTSSFHGLKDVGGDQLSPKQKYHEQSEEELERKEIVYGVRVVYELR